MCSDMCSDGQTDRQTDGQTFMFCPFSIKTIFPLHNFKTKPIFGILKVQRMFFKSIWKSIWWKIREGEVFLCIGTWVRTDKRTDKQTDRQSFELVYRCQLQTHNYLYSVNIGCNTPMELIGNGVCNDEALNVDCNYDDGDCKWLFQDDLKRTY